MFKVQIDDTNEIQVQTRKFNYKYAIDGSLANPLEATYAALAGCAGVYALKAARKLQKPATGIEIHCKSVVKPDNPGLPAKWVTEITFPDNWTDEEQSKILSSIKECAVKELLQHGQHIDFVTSSKEKENSIDLQ
ncbi:MAG: OsmC family protein [Bdellovibrionales bacterium]|nr:OsmC family protein [Bdellovibrionales bacterium]